MEALCSGYCGNWFLKIARELKFLFKSLKWLNLDANIVISRDFFFRLTDTSDEDRAKQPMTETEMLQMPKYVAENRRCACPEDDCNYVTVDTFMLVIFLIKANSV